MLSGLGIFSSHSREQPASFRPGAGRVKLSLLLFRKGEAERAKAACQLLGCVRANNWRGDGGLGEQPCQRDLRGRRAVLACHCHQRINNCPAALVEVALGHAIGTLAGRRLGSPAVLAG